MTLLAAALLALLLLGACTGSDEPEAAPSPSPSSSSPDATPTRAAPVEPPVDRACYRLMYDDAVAPTSSARPTSCAKPHTSVTFLVGELDTAVDGHLLAVDSQRVQRQVASACPARLARFVGGTVEQRRLSMLRAVWFTPTVEESDEGANWFRCDVIAVAADGALAPLAGPLAGVLGTESGRERYAMCGTAEPGTAAFERVICSADHAWRAIAIVPFEVADHPGDRRVRAAGEAPCQEAGRAVADDPLNYSWSYERPTREQWNAGQTYGICWAPVG